MIFGNWKLLGARSTPAPAMQGAGFRVMAPPVAGVTVNPDTALTYSAYYACIRIISETIAGLPWHAFQRHDGRRELLSGDPVDALLYRRPNPEMTPFRFKELALATALGRGNAYFEIARTRSGTPGELWPIETDAVNPTRTSSGRLVYEAQTSSGPVTLNPEDVLHFRNTTRDGIVGLSVVDLARETISFGLATEQFGASFFGNGAVPAMVIKETNQKPLGEDGVRNLLRTFNKKNQGARRANRTEYLGPGFEIQGVGVPAKDAQFLESRKFQIAEVCRWFRMPPHKLADLERATFSNIESQNIQFVADTILPWTNRLESEVDFRLFGDDPDRYSKLNLNALLRGDMAARAAFYKELFYLGALSVDEIRELEEMDKLGGGSGDLRVVPANMIPLERARDQQGQQGGEAATTAARAVLGDICRRLARVEIKRAEAIAKKGDDEFVAGAYQFYAKHAESLAVDLTNAARAFGAMHGKDGNQADAIVREFAGRVAMDSADELQTARTENRVDALLRSWESVKADRMASALIDKLSRG